MSGYYFSNLIFYLSGCIFKILESYYAEICMCTYFYCTWPHRVGQLKLFVQKSFVQTTKDNYMIFVYRKASVY